MPPDAPARPRLALGLAVLAALPLLAGCAEPSSAECGLALYTPARPIDEGVRFDVREVVGDPLPADTVDYRITNQSDPGAPVAYGGRVGELLGAEGAAMVRFLDAGDDGLVGLGDAFVVREHGTLVLQLSRGAALVGSSLRCA